METCLFTTTLLRGCARGSCWLLGTADHQSLQEPGAEEAACTGEAVHKCSFLVLEKPPMLQECDAGQTSLCYKAG